jgi:glycosyltransferase involved in cell wall biosynthesis
MSKASKPTVSVIMAVYNGSQYLRPTLESILAQTFDDYEFIIVNDGSTDDTQKVIEGNPNDRIRLINNSSNVGQTASLNVGLQHACGKFIARTDAGDISTPERFRKQVQYLDNHPSCDILGTAAFQYDIAGNFCGSVFMPNKPSTILQRIFFACPVVHVSVMMRHERILSLGGYDESYKVLADYGLWARALQQGFGFWNLGELLAGYLVTPDSFGYSHGRGRSIQEAASIICEVALTMTGIQLSRDQAEELYRFFVFGPQDLDSERTRNAEALFETLLLKLHIPRRDIDYLLLRSYLKMLAIRWSYISSQKPMLKDALLRILSKCRGGFSFHMFEDFHRGIQSLRYRNFSAIGVKYPAFVCKTSDAVK